MKTDMDVFLRTPEHTRLHMGKVTAVTDVGFNASFESARLELEEGSEVLAFYEINRKFVQQPVRVLSAVREEGEDETRLALELETTADPTSAENRESYRVSCYASDVKAQLGDDPEMCEVLDVSATGFAVFSDLDYKVGENMRATLYHNGDPTHGTVVVQSYRQFGRKNRYGLRAIDDERPNAKLKDALARINLAVQLEQAARLSGNL